MAKNVQIPIELFFDLVDYFFPDSDTPLDMLGSDIRIALRAKLDSYINRELYTLYRRTEDAQEREKARQRYLDRRGVPASYRGAEEITDPFI